MSTHKYVLVTGGAGYVGAHTCKALAQAGYTPVVYASLEHGHDDFVQFGPLVQADLLDRTSLRQTFARYDIQAVLHFAAYAFVGESVEKPIRYYRNNIMGSCDLIETMLDQGVHKIVFSSTCAIYGEPQSDLLGEDHPKNPLNPYGVTKLAVERLIEDLGRSRGLEWMNLRYFNAAGADSEAKIGEDHSPETHLIPLVLRAAAKGEKIKIFGTDYGTPDGTCIRDYIHVSDLAQAHVQALRALEQGMPPKAYNLGTGRGYSVREVIQAAREVTGKEILVEETERRSGDPARLVADSTRAQRELRFEPRNSDLKSILESAWKWHLARHFSS